MPFAAPHEPEPGALTDQVQELQDHVEQLQHAVHSHAVIDQAIGVVLAVGKLTPEEAWDVLREISMRSNTKLRIVAEHLVLWCRTDDLPAALRTELQRQLMIRNAASARSTRPSPV
ncbi:ANTAR domain-containing protein [Streptomyces sp. NRRL B-1347]|uniref:ANTAR domain-containing protein n=1 Tax=Streptomyces sp. NRRL B-1347 TaxID=1476877 RepID=UPI0006921019|nr:ANTAR domain-containing protein [Streptomyces sp. NRRL B-1347]